MCLDAVGAPDIIVALVEVASVADEFHSNTSPSVIKQIALSPKLSSDHIPGSTIKSPDAASPHATKFEELVTVSPPECDAAVVFLTALVTPDKLLPDIAVYEISSVPICKKFVPEDGNCDASVNVILVVESLIPEASVVLSLIHI